MSHSLLLEMMPDFDEVESTVETIEGVAIDLLAYRL